MKQMIKGKAALYDGRRCIKRSLKLQRKQNHFEIMQIILCNPGDLIIR